MSSLKDSVVLIKNGDSDEGSYGTGFVIYHDRQATYVLTCAHVVNAISDTKTLEVGGATASKIVWGSEAGADLAVLSVEGLQDKPILCLSTTGKIGDKFTSYGLKKITTLSADTTYLTIPLHFTRGEQTDVGPGNLSKRIDTWYLKLVEDSKLEDGYSGSPVIDDASGKVIGVLSISFRLMHGIAIAIKALKEIWPDMPPSLFQEPELGTIPTSIKEADSIQGEIQIQGSTAELITQEEREKLIGMLYELPNIEYANVRHSLVSTLPAKLQSNIAFDKPPELHITEIVDLVISDSHFKLPDGSYPIIVLIENALNIVKKSKLGGNLQSLLETLQSLLDALKGRLGVVSQINNTTTSLDRFIQYLDNFILQMPALQYELGRVSDSFDDYIESPDCEVVRLCWRMTAIL